MERPEDFGNEIDGSSSSEYCRYCYQNGKFTDEGVTLAEKIIKNIEIAKEMGMPEEEARNMANTVLPNLKRWKK